MRVSSIQEMTDRLPKREQDVVRFAKQGMSDLFKSMLDKEMEKLRHETSNEVHSQTERDSIG